MKLHFTNEWLQKHIENEPDNVCISAGGKQMVLTQKEIDSLQIAGFSSVSELLARYFELQREKLLELRSKKETNITNAVGSNKCQVYVPNLYP